ncbi:MAG TPA: methionyl-tRNA formyltransferase [Edaphocola sp.]|nr:methionyl-tRNA formyltransferase [Edaphocola sp.]
MIAKEDLKIIFLGTPDFAVASLKAMIEDGYNIVAVVTAPDKPAGRGRHLRPSPVKEYAVAQNLPVLQPERLKNKEFLAELESYNADVQVVVAFRMLPELVWNMPPMGTINVHGSLLPYYRGAAPINWAIINGEKETGVTTFKLQHEIDTGDILLQHKEAILSEDNIGTVYEKLMNAGAQLLLQTLEGLMKEELKPIPQSSIDKETHAPKIFKEDCLISWEDKAERIHNLIRGLSPIPTAYTYLQEKQLKIFTSRYIQEETGKPIGSFESDGKTFLRFACADGWLYALDVQFEGKKRMLIQDFLRGYRF